MRCPSRASWSTLGFTLFSTGGTHQRLTDEGIAANKLHKLHEGMRPNVIDMLKNREITFIINTPSTHEARADEVKIRSTAVAEKTSYVTNMAAADASVKAIRSLQENDLTVRSIQEFGADVHG